jgi:hypothetical protein
MRFIKAKIFTPLDPLHHFRARYGNGLGRNQCRCAVRQTMRGPSMGSRSWEHSTRFRAEVSRNITHASDSVENAAGEIACGSPKMSSLTGSNA